MNSAIRSTGRPQGIEKRRSMWGFTWVPRPSRNRPPVKEARSQADWATTIGDRANATATEVPTSTPGAADAAAITRRNGSWAMSAVKIPSKPRAWARAARSATAPSGLSSR